MITKTEQNEIQDYLKDASNTKGYCEAVVYPETTSSVLSGYTTASQKPFVFEASLR